MDAQVLPTLTCFLAINGPFGACRTARKRAGRPSPKGSCMLGVSGGRAHPSPVDVDVDVDVVVAVGVAVDVGVDVAVGVAVDVGVDVAVDVAVGVAVAVDGSPSLASWSPVSLVSPTCTKMDGPTPAPPRS